MNFDHVSSKKLRDILTGNPNDAQMSWAIVYTKKALDHDANNENISYSVVDERINRFNKARVLFDIGMLDEALYFLKRTWEV